MLATLNLVRWPLGVAQVELWQAWRHRQVFKEATFSSVLLPIALRYMPLGIPDVEISAATGDSQTKASAWSEILRMWPVWKAKK